MRKTLQHLYLLMAVLLLSACSNTRLLNVWQDEPQTARPLKHVLVLGISNRDGTRRNFEDTFSAQLMKQGITAEPMYRLYADLDKSSGNGMTAGAIPEATLKQIVQRTGADGVLVTRLIRTEQRLQVTPGTPMGFYGFYNYAWMTYSPPMVDAYTVALLETNLWSAPDGRLLWSGTTETVDPEDTKASTDDFAKVVITALVKAHLLPQSAK